MSSAPPDYDERSRLLTSSSRRLFVEAGAGSGKTHELKSRVVEMIASDRARIDQIVVITFTEAAASELKSRIRHGLEQELQGPDSNRRSRCRAALDSLGQGYMGTIHGWAQRILKEHFLAAGLPPTFETMDHIESRFDLDASWMLFAARYLGSDDVDPRVIDLLDAARALDAEPRHLRQLHDAMSERWERCRPYVRPVEFTFRSPSPAAALARARELLEMRRGVTEVDSLTKYVDRNVTPWLDQYDALDTNDPSVCVRWFRQLRNNGQAKGSKKAWGVDLQVAKDAKTAIFEEIESALDRVRRPVTDGLLGLTATHAVESAGRRQKAGRLWFHDLLVFASDLMVTNDGALRAMKRSHRFVFVDEYQDTDPLQAAMIESLASGADGAAVFTVGDPRQSIYRFRGADVAQFGAARHKADETVGLTTNFRSVRPVVDWISAVSEALDGVHATPDNRLIGNRGDHDGLGTIELFGSVADETMRAPEVRRIEASELADRIEQLKADRLSVHEGGELRQVRYSDIAVLMPTRAALAPTMRALRERSVPFRVESRSLVWATQEVRDLVSILSAIDNADDEIALMASLTSPAFGCSDPDLVDWVNRGGTWDYRITPEGVSDGHPVAAAFDWLRQLHYVRWRYNVAHLTEIVVEQRRMYELAHLQDRQREAWHRLGFVQDKSHRWMSRDGGDGTLSGFLDWARLQIKSDADALESVVPEADDDAVRLMTVHASKGLEFPVVFLTGINSSPGNTRSVVLRWMEDRCVARIGNRQIGWGTENFAEDLQEEDLADGHERNRLLYVALTRAKDHLFVSLHRSKRARQSLAESLEKAASNLDLPPTPSPVETDDEASLDPARQLDQDAKDWARQRNAATSRARAAVGMSASSVNKEVMGEPSTPLEGPSREERMAFGTVVHKLLEHAPFDAADSLLGALAQEACMSAGLEHRVADAVVAVRLALDSEVMSAASRAEICRREVAVSTPLDGLEGRYAHGTIDLCYVVDGQWHVVDYKTDELSDPESPDRLIEHYKWQLLVYSVALQEATGIPVAQASLLLIDPNAGSAIVRSITPDAKERLALKSQLEALSRV